MAAKRTDDFNRAGVSVIRIASGAYARYAHFGMPAAVPVYGDNRLVGGFADVNDNLADQYMRQTLLGLWLYARGIPDGWQVVRERNRSGATTRLPAE